MKRKIKAIVTIAIVGIMLVISYLIGTTQPKTKVIREQIEVIPDGYIKLDECIPLDDISCYFIDENNYYCFELKDIGNQLDDPSNRSYSDIMHDLEKDTDH